MFKIFLVFLGWVSLNSQPWSIIQSRLSAELSQYIFASASSAVPFDTRIASSSMISALSSTSSKFCGRCSLES